MGARWKCDSLLENSELAEGGERARAQRQMVWPGGDSTHAQEEEYDPDAHSLTNLSHVTFLHMDTGDACIHIPTHFHLLCAFFSLSLHPLSPLTALHISSLPLNSQQRFYAARSPPALIQRSRREESQWGVQEMTKNVTSQNVEPRLAVKRVPEMKLFFSRVK